MNINLDTEKIEIIKKYITSNPRYEKNEDLFDEIFEEVIQRGLIILKSLDLTSSSSETYLDKIVSSAILYILEKKNKLEISNIESVVNIEENQEDLSAAPKSETKIESEPETLIENKYANVKIKYDFNYTPTVSNAKIKPHILQKFYDTVIIANNQNPEKEYLRIYNLRYVEKRTIENIAKELNMSAETVSKNLFELMEEVRENLE